MSSVSTYTGFKGMNEVIDALGTLPDSLKNRILKSVHREAVVKIMRPHTRSLPYDRKKFSAVGERGNRTAIIYGVHNKNYWLRFMDKGTVSRTNAKGANRGSVSGDKRITNIFESNAEKVVQNVQQNYGEIVMKHLNRRIRSVNKKIMKLQS
jgi:hypothetical protein